MKRVDITLLVDDDFVDGRQPASDVEESIRSYFEDMIREKEDWGGLNGAVVYVDRLERLVVVDL